MTPDRLAEIRRLLPGAWQSQDGVVFMRKACDELIAEVERLEREKKHLNSHCDALAEDVGRLVKEKGKLQADAARWQWVREIGPEAIISAGLRDDTGEYYRLGLTGDDADAAVDAARGAKG